MFLLIDRALGREDFTLSIFESKIKSLEVRRAPFIFLTILIAPNIEAHVSLMD